MKFLNMLSMVLSMLEINRLASVACDKNNLPIFPPCISIFYHDVGCGTIYQFIFFDLIDFILY